MQPKAAYIHIPFCKSKCLYCDFNSYAGMDSFFDIYTDAIIDEINSHIPHGLFTIYFGGGTPTVLDVSALSKILSHLPYTDNCEITIETNPKTADLKKLVALRNCGFNRLSIGVQSFDDNLLKSIGRIHTANDAKKTCFDARRAGFDNVSIDLIFALPNQTMTCWKDTLEQAVSLGCEHVSLYELSIEADTPFYNMNVQAADEDLRIDMYLYAINTLKKAGYEHYEVSNFAKPSFYSQHNLTYWHNKPYYGFGCGATEYINGVRSKKTSDLQKYISSNNSPIEESEHITGKAHIAESISLGLRLISGINLNTFEADILKLYPKEIEKLVEADLVKIDNNRLAATQKGLLLLNDVIEEFI